MKKLASFVLMSMFMLTVFFGSSACNGHRNNDDNNNCGFYGNGYNWNNWWGNGTF